MSTKHRGTRYGYSIVNKQSGRRVERLSFTSKADAEASRKRELDSGKWRNASAVMTVRGY